ncbi:MAG: diaminopimelate epimerase [Lachnospiraceae bacterium]|nr:diaminopimelate epimerase [Lachnospiraceae bacterium]
MKFAKMEGLGNDYVYIDCINQKIESPEKFSIKISDRHFGIGSDGLILILPSKIADFKMRMFNADGTEAEMCGNGIRCFGKFVYDEKLTEKKDISVETLAGIKLLNLNVENGVVESIKVDMGEPIFEPKSIPVISDENPVTKLKLTAEDKEFVFTCVSMGNPHAITKVDNVDSFDVKKYGSVLETDKCFPNKCNIEFIEVINKNLVKMRVWERGSGETLACGTGACATAVSCVLNGHTENNVEIELLGGVLNIEWNRQTNHIYMTGPAKTVYKGEI